MKREQSLPELLCLTETVLAEVRSSVEQDYTVYPVPKRRGVRWIEAPGPELKEVQRRLLDCLLYRLDPHPAAHGFCTGRNICTHASRHAGKHWVATVDIEDFFPSVERSRLEGIPAELELSEEDGACLLDLVTRLGRLPQGAPTSPHLGNLVMRETDARLTELAESMGWGYSRYADDLVISGEGDPREMLRSLLEAVAAAGFRANRRKCRVMGRHQRQWVTGLVVNVGIKVPREQRRALRAAAHQIKQGTFSGDLEVADGRQAFLDFIRREEQRLARAA